jgi:hypothetical protein
MRDTLMEVNDKFDLVWRYQTMQTTTLNVISIRLCRTHGDNVSYIPLWEKEIASMQDAVEKEKEQVEEEMITR